MKLIKYKIVKYLYRYLLIKIIVQVLICYNTQTLFYKYSKIEKIIIFKIKYCKNYNFQYYELKQVGFIL